MKNIQIQAIETGAVRKYECPGNSDSYEVSVTLKRARPYDDVTETVIVTRTDAGWESYGCELTHWMGNEMIRACEEHDREVASEDDACEFGDADPIREIREAAIGDAIAFRRSR
jgi:hypothetical protein